MTMKMHMLADEVVPIAPERERFFGCSGRMLLPCPSTVAAVVKEIPSGKVATLELLRSELARRAEVEAVCPFQTKQALRAIADQTDAVPLWRVVSASRGCPRSMTAPVPAGAYPGDRLTVAGRFAPTAPRLTVLANPCSNSSPRGAARQKMPQCVGK